MSNEAVLKKHKPFRENLLMILHDLQDHHPQRYLTEEALDDSARYLNLTRAEVYGVASYYSMFSFTPRGRYIIRVCVSAVCELLKSQAVMGYLEGLLGIRAGQTTPCGLFTLEASECLGQCQEAPSMMINGDVYNNLDEQRISQVIEQLRESGRDGERESI